jgi:flagellin-like hook-associated protein FlgL
MNGTYSEKSLNAINAECNTLVDEINRLYLTTEYNGVNLFLEMTQDENGNDQILQETTADETTTLKDLGIETSSFSVYDSTDTIIETYDVESSDTIGDIFTTLQTYGFTSNIYNGQITITSTNGSYLSGDLSVALVFIRLYLPCPEQ